MELFDLVYVAAGTGALLAGALPRLLADRPFSMPLVFLGVGALAFSLPLGLPAPDPVRYRTAVEHVAEAVVLVALMGAGLALNRPVGWRRWQSTWRLLAVAMPLTIGAVTLLGSAVLGLPLAAALLLGAVLAPTDPVLASDVQVGEPTDEEEDEDEVRFALTSEAGLNDGLAFPVVYAAIALAAAGGGTAWVGDWFVGDVLVKGIVGFVGGVAVGRFFARLFFRARRLPLRLAEHAEGFVALAVTFLAYGLTEVVGGYGFVAVFVAGCTIRAAERTHGYHGVLHGFIEQVERLLTAWLLLLLGGALVTGTLGGLSWTSALLAGALVLVVRPVAGIVAMLGTSAGWRERAVISFFGIRGIGSVYYLAYALGATSFGVPARELWSVVATAIVLSVVLHGVTATPVMRRLDLLRRARLEERGLSEPRGPDLARERL